MSISVYSSPCNFLLLGLILAPWLSLSIYFLFPRQDVCQEIDRERKEWRLGPKRRELPDRTIIDSPLLRKILNRKI